MSDAQVLVLDQAYRPLQVVHWTDAITMWATGKCEIVAEYDGFIRSQLLVIKMPAVVRLLNAFRRRKKPVKFSRINVYARDCYSCQYCGAAKRMSELTYDHVVPRSRGGRTEWTNIVAACIECNSQKGGRTPEQAGMRLLKKPVQPTQTPVVVLTLSKENVPDAWREWLYWTSELSE